MKTDKQILDEYVDMNFPGLENTDGWFKCIEATADFQFYKFGIRIQEFKETMAKELASIKLHFNLLINRLRGIK